MQLSPSSTGHLFLAWRGHYSTNATSTTQWNSPWGEDNASCALSINFLPLVSNTVAAAVEFHGLSREAQFSAEIRLIFSPEATAVLQQYLSIKAAKKSGNKRLEWDIVCLRQIYFSPCGGNLPGSFLWTFSKGGRRTPPIPQCFGGHKNF